MAKARLSYADRADAVFDASPVISLLVAAQRAGAPLRHDCGGKALCGSCRIRVDSGALSPMLDRERVRLDAVGAGPKERLACQAHAGSDLMIRAVLPLHGKHGDTSKPEDTEKRQA